MTIITPLGNTIEPVEVVTPEYLDAKIASAQSGDIVSHSDLEMRLSQIPTSDVTRHDLDLVNAAVDAKFDMLRSAIAEAVDFDTLKVRLLAVLE